MRTVAVANLPIELSEVVLGTMTFGKQVAEPDAQRMVDKALDAGITTFDTSNNYAAGESERIVGKALRSRRDDAIVITKAGSPVGQDDEAVVGLGRVALRAAVDGSLRRLDTDRIDILCLHRPDRTTPFEETLQALDDLVRSGKVLRVAQSNFAAWQITELNAIAEATDAPPVKIAQTMYNLLSRRVEAEYAECSEYLGLTDIAYNPLAAGLLTGKHRFDDQPADGSRFSNDLYRQRYWNPRMFAAVDALRTVAADAGLTLIELSLRWVAHQPLTDAVLLGASSLDHFESNLAALCGPKLDAGTLAGCDEVWRMLDGAVPLYNR